MKEKILDYEIETYRYIDGSVDDFDVLKEKILDYEIETDAKNN